MSDKAPEAFRTIGEVADQLRTPAHVLRFWESKFSQVKPVKRAGGRRYYRPADVALLAGIKQLLHDDGMTIRGVQKLLRQQGPRHVAALADGGSLPPTPAPNGAAPAPCPPSPAPVPEHAGAPASGPAWADGPRAAPEQDTDRTASHADDSHADNDKPAPEDTALDPTAAEPTVAAPPPQPLSHSPAEPGTDTAPPPPASGDADPPPAKADPPAAQPDDVAPSAPSQTAASDGAPQRPVARLRDATDVDPDRAKALLDRCTALRARLRAAAGAGR